LGIPQKTVHIDTEFIQEKVLKVHAVQSQRLGQHGSLIIEMGLGKRSPLTRGFPWQKVTFGKRFPLARGFPWQEASQLVVSNDY